MGRLVEEYGKVTAAYLKPLERGQAVIVGSQRAQHGVRYNAREDVLPMLIILARNGAARPRIFMHR